MMPPLNHYRWTSLILTHANHKFNKACKSNMPQKGLDLMNWPILAPKKNNKFPIVSCPETEPSIPNDEVASSTLAVSLMDSKV